MGDRVIATGLIEASGKLIAILQRGVNPASPQFTHQVKLDIPYRGFRFLRFDPADLTPDTTESKGVSDAP